DASKDVTNLTGRLETAKEDVSARAAEFDERLKVAGFSSLKELDAAALPAEDLAEREKDLKSYGEERLAAATTVSDLEKKLRGRERPDLVALRAALDSATDAAEQAANAWNVASNRAAKIADSLGR